MIGTPHIIRTGTPGDVGRNFCRAFWGWLHLTLYCAFFLFFNWTHLPLPWLSLLPWRTSPSPRCHNMKAASHASPQASQSRKGIKTSWTSYALATLKVLLVSSMVPLRQSWASCVADRDANTRQRWWKRNICTMIVFVSLRKYYSPHFPLIWAEHKMHVNFWTTSWNVQLLIDETVFKHNIFEQKMA